MAECTSVTKKSDPFFMASHTGLTGTSDKFPQPEENKPKKKKKSPTQQKSTLVQAACVLLYDVGHKKKVINIFGTLPLGM